MVSVCRTFHRKNLEGKNNKRVCSCRTDIAHAFQLYMDVGFGNSAIWFDMNIANGYLSKMANDPDGLMFQFLEYLPFTK